MNVYFLVEGKTEKYVYPQWIEGLIPEMLEIKNPKDVNINNFYIFSSMGFPKIHDDFRNTIKEKIIDKYDLIVVILDSDCRPVEEREEEVYKICVEENFDLSKVRVIVQDVCFETWCLGHTNIVKRNPQSKKLKAYLDHYDVTSLDPELMRAPDNIKEVTAQYHGKYLKEVFRERNEGLRYNKGKQAAQHINFKYYEQIKKRNETTNHLNSFSKLVSLFDSLKMNLSSSDNLISHKIKV
ncbi:hypothetical protein AR443_10920 [Bacillus velezensis]|nr:hypothetical protein AR443_10920 [Bacillus velezensis]